MIRLGGIENKYKRRFLLCIAIIPLILVESAITVFTEVLKQVPEVFINTWQGR
jgi:hypothetical protein